MGLLFLVLTIAAAGASCKRTRVETSANTSAAPAADDTAQTPPFSTREPERYQWTRVITSVVAGVPGEASQSVFMARDGDKRLEAYELRPGVKLIALRLPEGSYTLYEPEKIYAEVGGSSSDYTKPAGQGGVPQDFSADKLVNASRVGARYEKLGTEDAVGHTATKYRVTVRSPQGGVQAETIIWVDESLGMPVKSETISRSDAGESKYTVEYRDIKLEADPSLFVLPKDYRKVSQKEIEEAAVGSVAIPLDSKGKDNRNKKR